MKCNECGNEIKDNAYFCDKCGAINSDNTISKKNNVSKKYRKAKRENISSDNSENEIQKDEFSENEKTIDNEEKLTTNDDSNESIYDRDLMSIYNDDKPIMDDDEQKIIKEKLERKKAEIKARHEQRLNNVNDNKEDNDDILNNTTNDDLNNNEKEHSMVNSISEKSSTMLKDIKNKFIEKKDSLSSKDNIKSNNDTFFTDIPLKSKNNNSKKKRNIIIIGSIILILLIVGGTIFQINNNKHYKMNLIITSNINDADVYLNNEKIGTLKDGTLEIDGIRWSENMSVYVEKKMPNGITDASEHYIIKDGEFRDSPGEIVLNLQEPLNKDDIQKFLNSMYHEIYSSENKVYDAVKLMSYFDGKDSNPEFKNFTSLIDTFVNDADLRMISMTPTVETIERVDKNKYEVSFIIAYRFSFDMKEKKKEGSNTYTETNTYNKEQVFRYKKASFIIDYNEEPTHNGNYEDDNIEYIYDNRIKIGDLGGEKGFEKISDTKHKV